MTVLVIVALAIAWVVVLTRGRGRAIDPVASVDQQRRALDAIATAAQTARRSRRPGARTAGAPPEGLDGPRRARAPIVGLAVVTAVSLGVGVVMLPDRLGRSDRAEPATPRPSTADGTRGSDPRAAPSETTSTTRTRTTTTTRSPTTTTTSPLRSQVIGGDPASQQVEVERAGFELTVDAEGPCWVQVRSAPDAPVTYEGTLAPGASQTFPADATLWVRLGAPDAVRMRVDGAPLSYSIDGNTPANFTFAVAAGTPR